ncbi:MAG: response regulator [Ignavibacteria bacterium]|nr:MAG: response regulator [Ignavibacteria bacterium]
MNENIKILVVDDQISNIETLRYRLQKAGYTVLEALRGEDALQLATKEHPDLVLLDIMMPEVTGFEVCQRLLAIEETKHIPVILVTALTNPEYVQKGFEVGAFDYVKKPFDTIELMMRIKSALKSSRSNRLFNEIIKLNSIVENLGSDYKSVEPINKSLLLALKNAKDLINDGKYDEALKEIDAGIKLSEKMIKLADEKVAPMLDKLKSLLSHLKRWSSDGEMRNLN